MKNLNKKYLIIVLLMSSMLSWSQFLKTEGKKIVNENGTEVMLKGMGLGGWMLQEGYMMQSSDVADTQHQFKNRLIDLMGVDKTNEFYDAWLANHVTKKDIDSLAKWGFNSVRLPMHYNLFTLPIEQEPVPGNHTWLSKGFDMVDNLLNWCKANQMYLILDLHAAPGGQGANAAISDYDATKPSLWESEENKNKTIALWRKLAERYKDEPWIGGYDLLNEVNWNLPGNTQLKQLYVRITNAIREVDTKHIIFIEGNDFANNFNGLTPPWDSNMVYSFHKYWSHNDKGSIQWVLDIRNQHNVPLWMGEAGENSNVWFQEAISLFENHGIGWSWWPMKRVETIVGPYSITFSEGYKNILKYWRGQAAKPSVTEAYNSMMELANNTNSSNCSYQKDVPDAMIRQRATEATIPYKKHTIPGVVFMSDYDMGRLHKAYYDVDYANYNQSTGSFQAWNSGWVYRNDGVDIGTNTDLINSNGYHVGYVKKGEWINYTVNINETGLYKAEVRLAAQNNGGMFHLEINGEEVTATQTVTSTGGWDKFVTFEVPNIALNQGKQVLKLQFDSEGEFNISSIKFVKTGDSSQLPFNALNGSTTNQNKIKVVVNQPILAETVNGSKDKFTLFINDVEKPITTIAVNPAQNRTIEITTSETLIYTDAIKVTYNGTVITTQTGTKLETFSNLKIRNTLPVLFILPRKIEVEAYTLMEGLAIEDTSDTGGGKNFGYTDPGDYADYPIYSPITSNYRVDFRLASQSNAGQIGLYLVDANGNETELLKITTPVTGGWQTWTTKSANINIPVGIHKLRMRVLAGGFNFNWMEFVKLDGNSDSDGDGVLDKDDLCPNTEPGATVDVHGCTKFTLPVNNFKVVVSGETCPQRNNGKIEITATAIHNYKLTINGIVRSFTNGITLGSLAPGNYSFCITVDGQTYNQCFDLEVKEGKTLTGRIGLYKNNATVNIDQGSAPFKVFLNGNRIFETVATNFSVNMNQGDLLEVKTAVECEGVMAKQLELPEGVVAFPNPSKDIFTIALPSSETSVKVDVVNMYGMVVVSNRYPVVNGKITLNLSDKSKGIYIGKIYLTNPVTIKLIKE